MKSIIKNQLKLAGVILCVLFFMTLGCDKVEQPEVEQPEVEQPEFEQPEVEQPEVEQPEVEQPEVEQPEIEQPEVEQPEVEQPLLFTYPEKGKYGLNILAEEFMIGKRFLDGSNSIPIKYSIRAELPAGTSSLKIVIKSVKQVSYVCLNPLPELCGVEFDEWHEKCPKCEGVNMFRERIDAWVGVYESYIENWLFYNWDKNVNNLSITWNVYESGKPADAMVMLVNDFIIEYYENCAIKPTKVKYVKVVD